MFGPQLLLQRLNETCGNENVNVFSTSRREQDIAVVLTGLADYEVAYQNDKVDDSRVHVEHYLKVDPDLSKWDDKRKSIIIASLTSKLKGM